MATVLGRGGTRLGGANILIDSELSFGAGLSSSAALEVALGVAISAEMGAETSLREIALAGQKTEHEFVGVNSGIMDQFASAMGRKDHLCVDCRSHERLWSVQTGRICTSGLQHQSKNTPRFDRVQSPSPECEEGVRIIKEEFSTVESLRMLISIARHR